MSSGSLGHRVKQNLEYHNLWSDVQTFVIGSGPSIVDILYAAPPNNPSTTNPTDLELDGGKQWIIPQAVDSQKNLSVKQINTWFVEIGKISGQRPKSILIALVNDDSTVVYYKIHDGVATPKQ
ncbi:hypothetical protein CANTEDRAFT_110382 [Yamadazyma tenuis ATCC 10573]|uniref:tRNA-splicing endonuclease subunit Sen15 domain-containing protein n=1 Tax=Candida tenuis (strain ATCC 10573 / BCRC 21748 / CBS 615 / JCM 9827 / NBRC 10315 / NRRL Y-1498 / VKM Y-70) TaxID=590646 RepID=G3BDA4_CANTC|nr:uncharacterized protein CANTEDRAFT_110382 [Yamadazyma tenuis ATCC 10573]EGV60282.1 hypothetical protein CANTEDRAFT_110382 [Yamadazyma tenuis ATCC 10573]